MPLPPRLHVLGGHTATLLKHLNNPSKRFYSELSAMLQLYPDHSRVSLSLRNTAFVDTAEIALKMFMSQGLLLLYLLLGKLIFESKYRTSNLSQLNVIYRFQIIVGFFKVDMLF